MLFSFSALNSRVTKHKFLLFYTFFILTNLAYMLITYSTALNLVISLVKVLFNIVYVYISLDFFLACTTRGFDGGLNSDEYICGAVVLTTATIGLLTFSNTYFDIITPISVLLVLIFTYTFNSTLSLYFGAIIGLGYSIYYTTPIYISLFVLVSIISVAFKTNYKVFSVVGAVLSYILFSIYFIDYYMPNVFSIVSIIISGVIFQFTPLVVFESVVDILALRKPKIILLDVLNRSKHNIHSRLTEISAVFHQMDIVFRQMVKGDLDEITAKMLVKDDICHSLCKNCIHYKTCVSITDEMCGDMLSDVVNVAFAKNKMSVLDIPKGVATKCDVGVLCSVVNRSMHDIKSYSAVVKNMDSSKLLIANQLSGMSRLINSLATDINVSVSFDTSREKLIVEELSYKNIVVYECMVYEKDRNSLVVNLILSDSCINIKFIEKVVSKCCNIKMIVVSSEPTEVSHLNLVTLSIAPNYSFVFGRCF